MLQDYLVSIRQAVGGLPKLTAQFGGIPAAVEAPERASEPVGLLARVVKSLRERARLVVARTRATGTVRSADATFGARSEDAASLTDHSKLRL